MRFLSELMSKRIIMLVIIVALVRPLCITWSGSLILVIGLLISDSCNAKLYLTGRRIASHRLKSSSSVTSTANGDAPPKSPSVVSSNLSNGTGSSLKKSSDSVFSPDGSCLSL